MTEEEVFTRPDFAKNIFAGYPGVMVEHNMEGHSYYHFYQIYLERLWYRLNPVKVTG